MNSSTERDPELSRSSFLNLRREHSYIKGTGALEPIEKCSLLLPEEDIKWSEKET
jgi:hypothetical protein